MFEISYFFIIFFPVLLEHLLLKCFLTVAYFFVFKRLENVIEEITSKADEREFSSKNVEELTRGIFFDF